MSKEIVRPFLVFVVLAAGLNVVVALGSALFGARSAAEAFIALLGFPLFLVATAVWLAPFRERRRAAMIIALAVLFLGLLAGGIGLTQLVVARAHGVPMDVALDDAALLRDVAGLGLCAAGVIWGLACAGNILEPASGS